MGGVDGYDSVETVTWNIRTSYSDDGGITWSTMQKQTATSGHQRFPSFTANKGNEVFLVWHGAVGAIYKIRSLKNVGGTWGSITNLVDKGTNAYYPSTLFDPTFNFTSPLFVYMDTAKVGFYGTWTVTTISVTQGSIGQKTDKSNVLTYAITTDGTMSTITEKVNGVTVGTKTATSGQSLIAGLTQAQWDAVKFGKYKDVTGGLNTITVEMGTEVFTYTFDKRPATDADMISVAKAVQDSANVYLPAVKSKLGTAIRAKGGSVLDTDSLEVMAGALSAMTSGRKANGTVTDSAESFTATYLTGTTVAFTRTITVTGLTFKPSYIYVIKYNGTSTDAVTYSESSGESYPKTVKLLNTILNTTGSPTSYHLKGDVAPISVINGSFKLPSAGAGTYTWWAYE